MGESHLTRHMLRAVVAGDLPPRVLVELGWTHLLELCPDCRDEVSAWKRERQLGGGGYEAAFQAISTLIGQGSGRIEEERAEAQRDLSELLRSAPIERRERVRLSRRRFRGAKLGALLLEESRKRVAADPQDAYSWAELAEMVGERCRETLTVRDLIVLSQIHIGNALRVMGNLRGADARFRQARNLLRDYGAADITVCAEVDWYEGALRKDQRRLDEAEALLSRASMHFRMAGEHVKAARPLLTLGILYYDLGDMPSAIQATELALRSIPPAADPRFYLSARHNLTLYHCEGGDPQSASELLRLDRALYSEFRDAPTQLRLTWLQGKVAAALDRQDEAENELKRAREGFISLGVGYDAALVSFDLAFLYARTGRTAELRQLAEQIGPIFEAQDVHREAVAALLLFQNAARHEVLTTEAVRRLERYFRDSRNSPTLRSRQPS